METVEQSMETVEHSSSKTKRVRWGTVSVLEFRVGYNASTVPESGGPPVGLVGRPTRHSYSMLPTEGDDAAEASDSECESVDSDTEMLLAEVAPLLVMGRSRRRRNELWLDPMERARILAEEHAFPLEDIALICRDVRATLDARAFSQLEAAAEQAKTLESEAPSSASCACGSFFPRGPRARVLLY